MPSAQAEDRSAGRPTRGDSEDRPATRPPRGVSGDRPAARPRRTHAQARAEMRAGIIRVGNARLREKGAAGLSVREIARGLGVVSSALYRHVKNRDELLTLLVVDAYDDLADFALAAADAVAGAAAQFRALVLAAREWAVRNPERWGLLYGTPVPGYAAPEGATTPPGLRVMRPFAALLLGPSAGAGAAAEAAPPFAAPSTEYGRDLVAELADLIASDGAREPDGAQASTGTGTPDAQGLDPARVAAAVHAWTGFTGVISAEIFGQLGPILADHGAEQMEMWADEQIARFAIG